MHEQFWITVTEIKDNIFTISIHSICSSIQEAPVRITKLHHDGPTGVSAPILCTARDTDIPPAPNHKEHPKK